MEGIEVAVDPESINKYLAEQIMQSALGERLKEAVDSALESFGRYGSDPLKSAVQDEIRKQIFRVVSEDHAERIREAVRAALTDEELGKLVTGFVATLTNKIDRY